MTTNSRDVRDHVLEMLGADAGDFDVDTIVGQLVQRYDVTGIAPTMTCADIPAPEFWAIVRAEDVAFDETDPVTWHWLPEGYQWRPVGDGTTGEAHLFAPDGRNLSEAFQIDAAMERGNAHLRALNRDTDPEIDCPCDGCTDARARR